MTYIENPKTKGSGIICGIPQIGECPQHCEDCFFQSGRSYLEPLDDNLPNMPNPKDMDNRVLRVNDGNDSSHHQEAVIAAAKDYPHKFYNTAIPDHIAKFDAPVVLTVNPAHKTNGSFWAVEVIPKNLMFVRVRTNTWNLDVVDQVVEYYTTNEENSTPVVLTFMAYFEGLAPASTRKSSQEQLAAYHSDYVWRKRTTNSYYAITTEAWERVMARYQYNPWVHSCGKIEGEKGVTACRHCGNCLQEYFVTMERMRNES